MRTVRPAFLAALVVAGLALGANTIQGSPPPDASKVRRGLVNVGPGEQVFGGKKIFDGGVVIQADLVVDGGVWMKALQGASICGRPPQPGQTLVYDGTQWCPADSQTPDFLFAPPNGAGIWGTGQAQGGACACLNDLTDYKGTAVAITRSTAGTCYSADGQTITVCGANTSRVSTWRTDSTWLAPISEGASSQYVTSRRDLSNASWTKTNVTCALTATGMTGAANSASTCTATAPNGTVTFTITGSGAHSGSFHVKRRTGTGAFSVSRDLSTWTDISASLSSTLWKRGVPTSTWGCAPTLCIVVPALASTTTNPSIGFKFATSGDAVDIDFVQDENGSVATTPYDAASRGADQYSASFAGTIRSWSMQYAAQSGPSGLGITSPLWAQNVGGTHYYWLESIGGGGATGDMGFTCQYNNGSGTVSGGQFVLTPQTHGGFTSLGCDFGPVISNYVSRYKYDTAVTDNPPTDITTVFLGAGPSASTEVGGPLRDICIDHRQGMCQARLLNAVERPAVAWIGDSITFGIYSSGSRPPDMLGFSIQRTVLNAGGSGRSLPVCVDAWRTQIRGKGYDTLIFLCGINSIGGHGFDAASSWALIKGVLDEARADGMTVYPATITPYKNFTTYWSAGTQAAVDSVNASIRSYCTTNGLTCVDAYAGMGDTDPRVLRAACDQGDGLHPNSAGSKQLACLVQSSIQGFSPSLCTFC